MPYCRFGSFSTHLLVSEHAVLYFSHNLADLLSFILFFSWRLSSIAYHVSGVINSFFFESSASPNRFYFLHQRCSSPCCFHCWFTVSAFSLSCSSMLLKAWNLFPSCRTKAFLVLGSCSLLMSCIEVVCLFGPGKSEFQSHICSHKMVIAACVSPSSYSYVKQAAAPHTVNHQMIYLVGTCSSAVGQKHS